MLEYFILQWGQVCYINDKPYFKSISNEHSVF